MKSCICNTNMYVYVFLCLCQCLRILSLFVYRRHDCRLDHSVKRILTGDRKSLLLTSPIAHYRQRQQQPGITCKHICCGVYCWHTVQCIVGHNRQSREARNSSASVLVQRCGDGSERHVREVDIIDRWVGRGPITPLAKSSIFLYAPTHGDSAFSCFQLRQ